MEMPKIALLVAGNNQSNGGYSVIYSLNAPAFTLPAINYGGHLDTNSYYVTVCTTETYTLFTLVQNHVRSYGAVRDGFLKIGISVPRGYCLADDASPYDALLAVRDLFLTTCMEKVLGEEDTYSYKATMAAPDAFTALLDRYPLVPTDAPIYPMKGASAALLVTPESQMRLRLGRVNTPQFANYCELIVAAHGEPVEDSDLLPATVAVTDTGMPLPTRDTTCKEDFASSHTANADKVSDSEISYYHPEEQHQPFHEQRSFFATTGGRIAAIAAVAVVSLIIGVAVGSLLHKSPPSEPQEPTIVRTAADTLNSYIRRIYADDALTFQEVKTIKAWVNSKATRAKTNQRGWLSVEAYNRFAATVNKYEAFVAELQDDLNAGDPLTCDANDLNDLHRRIFEDFEVVYEAHPEAAREAKKIKSFADMATFTKKYAPNERHPVFGDSDDIEDLLNQ